MAAFSVVSVTESSGPLPYATGSKQGLSPARCGTAEGIGACVAWEFGDCGLPEADSGFVMIAPSDSLTSYKVVQGPAHIDACVGHIFRPHTRRTIVPPPLSDHWDCRAPCTHPSPASRQNCRCCPA